MVSGEGEELGYIARTEGVTRVFNIGRNEIHALRGVSVSIDEKKLVALKGRSGSGKTTLMNIIGMLDRPTAGRVFFLDREVGSLDEKSRTLIRKKDIGFIFQSLALISYMTAYENVEFILKVAGYPPGEIRKRAEECLSFVGLHKRMNHRTFELSGGEQQRVGIARAFAHKPRLILADEPTAELDTHMGLQVIKIFKDLVEKEPISIIMATHDPAIMEVADNVYSLEDGQILQHEAD